MSKHDSASAQEQKEFSLEEYRARSFNVLVPTQTLRTYSDMHEPVLEQVFLSPNPDDGDVYVQEQGNQRKPTKYALTKQALMKLSLCAGIMWHPAETRRTDDRSDKNYVSYQAVGGVRKSDGTWVFWKGEYDLDFEVIEMELEEQYRNKAEKYEADEDATWWQKKTEDEKEAYIQRCIRRDLLQKRKHKLKLAESGAMNRVIRAVLGMKSTYTKKELEQPFVVARVVFRPDYSDPEVRRQLTEASIDAMTSIYGPPRGAYKAGAPAPGSDPGPGKPPDQQRPPGSHTIIDVEPEEPPDPENGEAEGGPPEGDSREVDFINSGVDDQIKTLTLLAARKGYDMTQLKRPILQWEPEHRIGFFRKLNSMPDKEENPY